MKKKNLVLKTETVRHMAPANLREVVGGSSGGASQCVYVNTAIIGGLKSIVSRCMPPISGGVGGDDF